MTSTARKLASQLRRPAGFSKRRQAVVVVADMATTTVSIQLGGDTTTLDGIAYLASYTPRVGDVVWVDQVGADLLVLGSQGAAVAAGGGPRGILAMQRSTVSSGFVTSPEARDANLGNTIFTAEDGRRYRLAYTGKLGINAAGNTNAEVRIRDGGAATPTIASALLLAYPQVLSLSGGSGQLTISFDSLFDCADDGSKDLLTGTHTLSVFIVSAVGQPSALIAAAGSPKIIYVEDVGAW